MRRPVNFLSLSIVLLLGLISIQLPTSAGLLVGGQRSPSLPFQLPQTTQQLYDKRSLYRKLRDGVIRTIWRVPACPQLKDNNAKLSPPRSSPPSTLLARYGGDVVLRFEIHLAEESKALAEAAHILFLDVWEFNSDWVDIRLSKDVVPSLLGLLPASLQHAHTPLMHDLAQAIYESYPSPAFTDLSPASHESHRSFSPSIRTAPDETNIFFQEYQPLSVMIPWMRLLQSLFPTHVRLINIGISYEGRDIPALRVGVHPTNSEKPSGPRKSIIIAGGVHAREWISISTVNYVAYSLITSYGKSKTMTKLLEEFDWIFIPTLNPDGYVYTWENDRLWRKNRQQTSLRFCKGVDLDRTYGFEWDGEASKNNPCSESFSGEAPFQGVESSRLANWVKNETENNNAEFVGFLDFHSYSQQVLYPYSYSCTSAPPSLENLEELAMGLAKSIRQTTGEAYGVTSACEGSVTASGKNRKDGEVWPRIESGGGSALDWFYHEMHVRYAYQIKLRDTGSYGFLLPSKNIIPTGKEAFNAVTYFGQYLLGNKGIETLDDDVLNNVNAAFTTKQGDPLPHGGHQNPKPASIIDPKTATLSRKLGYIEETFHEYENIDTSLDDMPVLDADPNATPPKTEEEDEEDEEEQESPAWELRKRRRG